MLDQREIERALKKLEEALPQLKKATGPFQAYSIAGIIDGLKWVLEKENHVHILLNGIKEAPAEPEPKGLILPPMSTNS